MMDNAEHIILFLLGTLQVIAIGMTTWTLTTLIKLLQRVSQMEGKFDAFPTQQISNNRHRVEQLERHQETVLLRMSTLEKMVDGIKAFCQKQYDGNL